MKLNLVVLTPGKAQGQAIPVSLAQFVIGRDPQCNLRPASALISKRHCALIIRGEKAFIRDFDSTNGTFLNDQPVKDEVELHGRDRLKVGPLLFEVQLEARATVSRPTPPPTTKKPAEAGRHAQPADDDTIANMLLAIQDQTDPSSGKSSAMQIPEGSTDMEITAVPPDGSDTDKTEEAGKESKVTQVIQGNTSTAAKAILEKYMRRPRT